MRDPDGQKKGTKGQKGRHRQQLTSTFHELGNEMGTVLIRVAENHPGDEGRDKAVPPPKGPPTHRR